MNSEHLSTPTEQREQEITHNCGIVGFYYSDSDIGVSSSHRIDQSIYTLSKLQHRGQEGSGVYTMTASGQSFFWETSELLINSRTDSTLKHFRDAVERNDGPKIVIGHNRYSTSGDSGKAAGQPFYDADGMLVTAHNGNLVNPVTLPGYCSDSVSDTRVLHDTIKSASGSSLDEKIANTLPEVNGAYSLILADPLNQSLYGIRDPWGMRPLHVGRLKNDNGFVLTSETVSIQDIVDSIYDIKPGEGIKITDGRIERFFHDPRQVDQASCIFESVYFARPESNLFGMNVGKFRRRSGERLAQQDFEDDIIPDIVVPIRNSGTVGAEGYSRALIQEATKALIRDSSYYTPEELEQRIQRISDLVLQSGVNTNQYGRVFIEHGDRSRKAEEKYTVDPHVVEGKRVMLVDDSLVRGTTSQVITRKLIDAGALEVHWRFLSPRVVDSCYWGIDFPDTSDLAALDKTDAQIAHDIGADSVRFLDRQDMLSIAHELSGGEGFCSHCFGGAAPMEVNREYMIFKDDIRVSATR